MHGRGTVTVVACFQLYHSSDGCTQKLLIGEVLLYIIYTMHLLRQSQIILWGGGGGGVMNFTSSCKLKGLPRFLLAAVLTITVFKEHRLVTSIASKVNLNIPYNSVPCSNFTPT